MKTRIELCLFLIAAAFPLSAQPAAGLGAITGLVRDNSGASIPGAEVVVANAMRGVKRTTATNEAGVFSVVSLTPAEGYTVTIGKSGMAPYRREQFDLHVGENLAIDVVLQVAGPLVEIDIETAPPLVQSSRMDVSQVVNTAQIDNLPINGRRVDSFVLLSPGVVPDSTFGLLSFRGVAGGNSFLTDGNDTTDQYYNENAARTRITTHISQDAVQEF